jgi:hypothetical protein
VFQDAKTHPISQANDTLFYKSLQRQRGRIGSTNQYPIGTFVPSTPIFQAFSIVTRKIFFRVVRTSNMHNRKNTVGKQNAS